jgi:hypothetical protein
MPFTYRSIKKDSREYNTKSGRVKMKCEQCDTIFLRRKSIINQCIKRGEVNTFCSLKCSSEALKRRIITNCKSCNKQVEKTGAEFKKSKTGNFFCSKSCAAKYNNTHKKHGTRRSKLETWLEKRLTSLYQGLEIHFNRKDAINSELDIYIPALKLAFELNGIFHYEPIFGSSKLASIQNNDDRKFQACIERDIELCTIDVSQLNYFKETKAQKYLNIISGIINMKLSGSPGFEPSVR